MPVREQSSGADGAAVVVQRRGMDALRVVLVHLDPGRYALLPDEDLEAYRGGRGAGGFPGQEFDSEHAAKV